MVNETLQYYHLIFNIGYGDKLLLDIFSFGKYGQTKFAANARPVNIPAISVLGLNVYFNDNLLVISPYEFLCHYK